MSTARKKILSLSVADRLQLLEEIWDSLAETPEDEEVARAEGARRDQDSANAFAGEERWNRGELRDSVGHVAVTLQKDT